MNAKEKIRETLNKGKTSLNGTTLAQRRSLLRLVKRNVDGLVRIHKDSLIDVLVIEWCGMYTVIERDGYAHT